jgi:hypothetical protein
VLNSQAAVQIVLIMKNAVQQPNNQAAARAVSAVRIRLCLPWVDNVIAALI